MEQRDDRILDHIGLYRVSLRAVLARVFFEGGNPGNVVQRLLDEGFIRSRRLRGRLHYYQLTGLGASRRGFSRKRTARLGAQSLHGHLAALWFCCLTGKERHRLEKARLVSLFGANTPSGKHCIERDGGHRVYRLFVAGARTDDANLLHRLERYIDAVRRCPVLGDWIANRQYAFAILTEESRRVEVLRGAVMRHDLNRLAHVHVEWAPGYRNIGEALRAIQ